MRTTHRSTIWPALEERKGRAGMRVRLSSPPQRPTEPVDAYAAYLAWLELEARAARSVGCQVRSAA